MRSSMWWFVVLLALPAAAQNAEPDSAHAAAIRELLDAQRTGDLMVMGMEMSFEQQRANPDPNLPAGFMDSVLAYARRDIPDFIERLVPIYAEEFTRQEALDLAAFYRSPLGQRMIAAQPAIQRALGQEAEQWGIELAGRVLVDLSRRPRNRQD